MSVRGVYSPVIPTADNEAITIKSVVAFLFIYIFKYRYNGDHLKDMCLCIHIGQSKQKENPLHS